MSRPIPLETRGKRTRYSVSGNVVWLTPAGGHRDSRPLDPIACRFGEPASAQHPLAASIRELGVSLERSRQLSQSMLAHCQPRAERAPPQQQSAGPPRPRWEI